MMIDFLGTARIASLPSETQRNPDCPLPVGSNGHANVNTAKIFKSTFIHKTSDPLLGQCNKPCCSFFFFKFLRDTIPPPAARNVVMPLHPNFKHRSAGFVVFDELNAAAMFVGQ